MAYEITVLDSGFVSHDTLKPIGYAGEVNSRILEISHPHFKDCYYQLWVKRYDGLYKMGIENGQATVPPSLLRTATTLECQFVAMATPCSVANAETDPFIFKSNAFSLRVDEGLSSGGISPIPTYEELQTMYCNINAAMQEVENAKKSNEQVYQSIQAALQNVYNTPVVDLEQQFREEYKKQLDQIAEEHFEEFTTAIVDEITDRLINGDIIPGSGTTEDGMHLVMTKEELTQFISDVHNDLIKEIKTGTASWFPTNAAYTMSRKGDIIGG